MLYIIINSILIQYLHLGKYYAMTAKELKKLSRLELLEILLEETKENERLKAELKTANNIIKNANILSDLICKMDTTLNHAQDFTDTLQQLTENISETSPQMTITNIIKEQSDKVAFPDPSKENLSEKSNDTINNISDKKLYVDILNYYLTNETALRILPQNIQNNIKTRLRGILDAKKQNTLN